MKTFLEFLNEGKRQKKAPRYKGTPVVVDTHGSHAKDDPQQKLKFQGTPVVVDTHGSHAKDKKPKKVTEEVKYVNGKWVSSEDKVGRVRNSTGMPKPGTEYEDYSDWNKAHENHHLGSNPEEVHQKLHKLYPYHQIPNQHEVHEYTSQSRPLNRQLLHHYIHEQEPDENIHDTHVPSLDAAVEHHELHHDLHVYSGVGFHPGQKAAEDPEHKLFLPAYTSTSIHKGTAASFGEAIASNKHPYVHGPVKHVLHIHLKKGQKGLYVGEHSGYDNENEFVLPRNTTLRVHPKPSVVHYNYGSYPIHVWHAHVVPNETESDKRQLKLDFGQKKTNTPAKKKKLKDQRLTKDDHRLLKHLESNLPDDTKPGESTPLAKKIAAHVKKDSDSPF